MDVLDEEDRRTVGGQLLDESDCGRMETLASVERVEVRRDVEPEGEPEDLAARETRDDLIRGRPLAQPEVLAHHLAERPVRDPRAVGEAPCRCDRAAPASSSASASQSSLTSRDLPTPGSPTIVTRCGSDCAAATPVRGPKQLELAVPTDEDTPEPAHATRPHGAKSADDRGGDHAA